MKTAGKRLPTIKTRKRRISTNEPLWVVADFGNSDVKFMIHGAFGEEIVFPQWVRKVNGVDYQNLAESYKHRVGHFKGTAIFQMSGEGYVVGRHAMQVGDGRSAQGPDKYERDHIGALLAAALLQVYPEGHPDVHLVVLHPVKTTAANMKRLWKSLKGAFNLKVVDGRKVSYDVKEIIPLEEPVAAFQTFVLTQDGTEYVKPKLDMSPESEFLIVDIGGWISSMAPGIITEDNTLEINVSGSTPIQTGIQSVMETFEALLKDRFEELSDLQELPSSMLSHAMRTGVIIIDGDPHDCSDLIADAMQTLITALRTHYYGKYNRGRNYRGIVVCGGGGAASFAHLLRRLFGDRGHVYAAEPEMNMMRFGAIRGASKGLYPFLEMRELNA